MYYLGLPNAEESAIMSGVSFTFHGVLVDGGIDDGMRTEGKPIDKCEGDARAFAL